MDQSFLAKLMTLEGANQKLREENERLRNALEEYRNESLAYEKTLSDGAGRMSRQSSGRKSNAV